MFLVPLCRMLSVSVQLFQTHVVGSPYTVPVSPSQPCAHSSSLDEQSLCEFAGQSVAVHLQVRKQNTPGSFCNAMRKKNTVGYRRSL